jgi:hypothetical protein
MGRFVARRNAELLVTWTSEMIFGFFLERICFLTCFFCFSKSYNIFSDYSKMGLSSFIGFFGLVLLVAAEQDPNVFNVRQVTTTGENSFPMFG